MDADIVNRQATSASIAGTLVGTFAPLAINTIMMLFYLILMLRYSVPLTLIDKVMELNKPEMELILFNDEDIVCSSSCPRNNTTDIVPIDD